MQEMQEKRVWSLGQEDPLEMASHSSSLAWKIPWTEEPGRLQSTGLQRVRHDWAHMHTHRKQHMQTLGRLRAGFAPTRIKSTVENLHRLWAAAATLTRVYHTYRHEGSLLWDSDYFGDLKPTWATQPPESPFEGVYSKLPIICVFRNKRTFPTRLQIPLR